METKLRSITKAITYNVLIILYSIAAVFLFAKKTDLGLYFVIASLIILIAVYFLHERIWNKIRLWQE